MVEYLDPSIAGEGESANNWSPGAATFVPGAWTDNPAADEEWQPDKEAPHINDYAAFKKHKHYAQYFRPYRYRPFPAWMYHPTKEPKLIALYDGRGLIDNERCKAAVQALGPEWSPTPPKNLPRDMTGKSLPVKNDTQRLTEALVQGLTDKKAVPGVDPATIAAIVAAVMAAQQQSTPERKEPAKAVAFDPPSEQEKEEFTEAFEPEHDVDFGSDKLRDFAENGPQRSEPIDHVVNPDDAVQRTALLELAQREGVKIDGRWGNDRIKKELGIGVKAE